MGKQPTKEGIFDDENKNPELLNIPPDSTMILVVDDSERNRRLLGSMITSEGYEYCEADNGKTALSLACTRKPDIILLDIMMPDMNGYQVAESLKQKQETRDIPIIMVTALQDQQSRIRGLAAGAEEFVSKPVHANELQIRVRNLLRLKKAGDILKKHQQILEAEVAERTEELQTSFVETIYTLMRAAEYRDDETGAHVARISYYTKALAEELGMDASFCDTIHYASPMHDIGKIGISDNILLKPGGFEPDEWEIMQTHTTIGAGILKGHSSPYLQMGHDIALSHHERWDGGGYPRGIKGEAIPFPARIMQICDVYDALRSKRPYKPAFDHAKTMHIITKGDGRTDPAHFDPDILSTFRENADMFRDIYENHDGFLANRRE
ncbi:MAG: response regulator [Mariprofundaceae bacterium]|nr:response regulator [Mariprofundaceae bacterium]